MEERLQAGRDRGATALRVYLAGEILVEAGQRLVQERQLPGPLGRHLLALLAAEHGRAIGHDEIAEEIWNGTPPAAWRSSLKALVSRTRATLMTAGLPGASLLAGAPGVYRFCLPADGWVDLNAARSATHAAETKLSRGDLTGAAQDVFVAKMITARPLLAGATGSWLDARRAWLSELRLRAVQCSTRIDLARGAFGEAAREAQRAVELSPLQEPNWWLLLDAYAAAGDLASAVDAYERCRGTLFDALGITPSPATRERHAALLAQSA